MGFFTNSAKLLLVVLATIGYFGTWKLGSDDGLFDMLKHGSTSSYPTLPSSQIPLKTSWTGFEALDHVASTFVSFFWPIIQGDLPELSVMSFHFYGQFIPVWMLLTVESYRVGNRWLLFSFATIWGILCEGVAVAIVLPLWLSLHLATSPVASARLAPSARQTSLLVHPSELKVIPLSILIGSGVPTALILLTNHAPKAPIWTSAQLWLLVRLFHPLWTAITHLVLSIFSSSPKYTSIKSRNRDVTKGLRRVYTVAMLVSGLTHWGVVILSLASRIMPFMFAEKYQDSLSPVAMFDPAPFWTGDVRTSESVHEGVLMFLQWDELVCCLSILVWAVAINRDSLYAHDKGSTFKSMVWRLVFGTIVAGPAAAAISLVLERDEALLESSEQTLEKRED